MTNFGPGQQEVMEVPSIVIRQVGAEELARENWRCKTYSQSVTNIAVELEARVPIRQHITMIANVREPRRVMPSRLSCSVLQINYDAYYHE